MKEENSKERRKNKNEKKRWEKMSISGFTLILRARTTAT